MCVVLDSKRDNKFHVMKADGSYDNHRLKGMPGATLAHEIIGHCLTQLNGAYDDTQQHGDPIRVQNLY